MYRLLLLSIILFACQSKQAANNSAEALVNSYFEFQKALTEDNSEHTSHHIDDMKEALSKIKLGNDEVKNRLTASLDSYIDVIDLKTQRELFQELSSSVAYLVNTIGYSNDVYVMQCPMAFEGKGATWLQASAVLVNPYYGTKMLKCGDQVTVIAAKN